MDLNYIEASSTLLAGELDGNGRNVFIPISVALLSGLGLLLKFWTSNPKSKSEPISQWEEPSTLHSSIPFVGHLIGMLRYQVGYMSQLSSKVPSWPAFKLQIFSSRIYVICDPALVQATFKNTKSFDFGSFVVESSERAFNISSEGMKIMRGENTPGYDSQGPYLNGNIGECFLNDNHKLMVEKLSKGDALNDLSREMLEGVASAVNGLDQEESKISVYSWMRDVLTLSTSSALYGPENPLAKDPGLVDHLWNFEEKMTYLMLKFLPKIIAKDAYDGRAATREAFKKYYSSSDHLSGSQLIRDRLYNAQKWGFTAEDIANFEISTLYVATTNTVATSFWMLCHILSQESLLEEIRFELDAITTIKEGEACMHVNSLITACPLLLSSFHETLRLVISATSVRSVISPVDLSSPSVSYSIKSPAVIQLPSGITHSSPKIWGSDAHLFNPRRFLPSTKDSLDRETKKIQKDGFFPFGGGKHLCPGRHFATMEILSFVAALCAGFDFQGAGKEDIDAEGRVKLPERAFQKLGTAVRKPTRDVELKFARRKGWEDVRWGFEVGSGKI